MSAPARVRILDKFLFTQKNKTDNAERKRSAFFILERFFIPQTPTFDLKQTLDCGQVFRYVESDGVFDLKAGGERAIFTKTDSGWQVDCTDVGFFQKYLDFDTKYDIIQSKVQDKGLVSSAIEHGKGVHILRQDLVETVFSFIISQNNHIPRIKAIIERICDALGEDKGGYKAFPTVETLASKDADWYASIGAGYRAEYLSLTAKRFRDEGVPNFQSMDTDTARATLLSYKGIGRKVADCVLLFGLGRMDVFPTDTWIVKIFKDEYPKVPAEKLAKVLVERFGEHSGYVQQWLFYYKREKKV